MNSKEEYIIDKMAKIASDIKSAFPETERPVVNLDVSLKTEELIRSQVAEKWNSKAIVVIPDRPIAGFKRYVGGVEFKFNIIK